MIYLKVSYSMFSDLSFFCWGGEQGLGVEIFWFNSPDRLKRESSEGSPLIYLYKVKGNKVPVEAKLFWFYSEG